MSNFDAYKQFAVINAQQAAADQGQQTVSTTLAGVVLGARATPSARERMAQVEARLRIEADGIAALLKALPAELPKEANGALCALLDMVNR